MFVLSSRYAYQISLFDTEHRQTGPKFEGLVTSTLKPIESQCAKTSDVSKSEVFVTTFAAARNYTDQWANLNFIIRMKKLVDEEENKKDVETVAGTTSTDNTESTSISSRVINASGEANIPLPSNSNGSNSLPSGSASNSHQGTSNEANDAEMEFEDNDQPSIAVANESQTRQSSSATAVNIPIVTSTS